MDPTDGIVERLQALIDRGTAEAGPALRATFQLPEHALSARQLLRYWGASHQQVALATVTSRSEPRIAPVGALLRDAAFYVPTARDAARLRHIRRNPNVSLTHWISQRIAVIAHGHAAVISFGETEFEALDRTYNGGDWWGELRAAGNGSYVRVDPTRIYTWAADPATFPEV